MDQNGSAALIVAIVAVVLGGVGLIGGVLGYVQGTTAVARATHARQRAVVAEEEALRARTAAEEALRAAEQLLDRRSTAPRGFSTGPIVATRFGAPGRHGSPAEPTMDEPSAGAALLPDTTGPVAVPIAFPSAADRVEVPQGPADPVDAGEPAEQQPAERFTVPLTAAPGPGAGPAAEDPGSAGPASEESPTSTVRSAAGGDTSETGAPSGSSTASPSSESEARGSGRPAAVSLQTAQIVQIVTGRGGAGRWQERSGPGVGTASAEMAETARSAAATGPTPASRGERAGSDERAPSLGMPAEGPGPGADADATLGEGTDGRRGADPTPEAGSGSDSTAGEDAPAAGSAGAESQRGGGDDATEQGAEARDERGRVAAAGGAPTMDWAEALRTGAIPLPAISRGTYAAPRRGPKPTGVGPARFELRAIGRQRFEAVNVGGEAAADARIEGAGDDPHLVRPLSGRPSTVQPAHALAFSVLRVEGRRAAVAVTWVRDDEPVRQDLPID